MVQIVSSEEEREDHAFLGSMTGPLSIVGSLTILLAVAGLVFVSLEFNKGIVASFITRLRSTARKQPNIVIIVADDFGFHDVGYHESDINSFSPGIVASFITRLRSTARKQPNIVIIVADDYGFHDVGYHESDIKTPNLDDLATNGVRLENYYVQPICSPTRSQLLSGRYQIHTGLQHGIIWQPQPNGIPLEDPLIADKLKEAGYKTHAVGKWHVGFYKKEYQPTSRGFDTFYGMQTGSADHYTHINCYHFGRLRKVCGYDLLNNTEPDLSANGTYSTHLYTNKAISIVENHDRDKPLFLYLAYQAVHAPIQVPEHYLTAYKGEKNEKRKTYAAMVTCMDEAVGRLVASMKRAGLWDNTVLVFTTDNGGVKRRGASNWPLRGYKGSLWEGGMRAVGFVHSNLLDSTVRGGISRELIHVTDWFPTLVRLAGGSLNGTRGLDGFDQWKTISTNAESPRKELLHNIDPTNRVVKYDGYYKNTFNTSIRAALRVGDMKILTGWLGKSAPKRTAAQRGNVWLFNITADPSEQLDLSITRPALVRRMLDRLQDYQNTAVPVRYPPIDPRAYPANFGGFWKPWL